MVKTIGLPPSSKSFIFPLPFLLSVYRGGNEGSTKRMEIIMHLCYLMDELLRVINRCIVYARTMFVRGPIVCPYGLYGNMGTVATSCVPATISNTVSR
jgi:hypothetical protein